MGREENAPFSRGETFYNGGPIDATDNTTLGGVNLEGKEFVFEPNSSDSSSGFSKRQDDQSGRPVRVKVVRNSSGVNLKGGRLAHFSAASTVGGPYGTRVDGYTILPGDRPAGVVDEYLPPAGVPANDLFYIVVGGPTSVTNTTTAATFAIGTRLVPATAGATAGDDLGGRVAPQDLTGATSLLANQVQHTVGYANAANTTSNAVFSALASLQF